MYFLVDLDTNSIIDYSAKIKKIFPHISHAAPGCNVLEFFREIIPSEDVDMVDDMFRTGLNMLSCRGLNAGEYIFSYITGFKTPIIHSTVHHNSSIILVTEDGIDKTYIISSMGFPADFEYRDPLMMSRYDSECYQFNPRDKAWSRKELPSLTIQEKSVIILSTQGLNAHEIAAFMDRSLDTIKAYKRGIFEKLGAKNISQAIAIAQNYNLI